MKSSPSSSAPRADGSVTQPPGPGRRLVVGAGVAAGAALAVAAVQRHVAPKAEVAADKGTAPTGQGYRLTDHIRRYYETTRT